MGCRQRASSVLKYDAAYAARKDFVAGPNAFLAECLRRIAANRESRRTAARNGSAKGSANGAGNARGQRPSPRKWRALDVGLGEGRNAILLAQRGYLTTGIDRSPVGVAAARRLATGRGVRIDAVLADTEEYDFGRDRWDLIALLYYPQPMILIDRLKEAVRPGGYIVIERFSRPKSCNPRDRRETQRPSPMLRCFLDWSVLHYENDEFKSDWHWNGESPSGPIIRLLARKPPQARQ